MRWMRERERERERPMQGASELPGPHDDLFLAVIVEHLTVESVTSGPALRIPARSSGELARRRANHGSPTIVHGDVQAQIGAVHGQAPSAIEETSCSSSHAMRCVRLIQGSGRMHLTQSANDGMYPRSSITCCSPTQRVGMTRPEDKVMVGPKMVSAMKMPSAWWRSARCRKSAVICLLASNQLWIAR